LKYVSKIKDSFIGKYTGILSIRRKKINTYVFINFQLAPCQILK